MDANVNYFDRTALDWDTQPRRVELARAVGEAVVRQVPLTKEMDVLDYGCGTGLVGLFLHRHVRSVTGADSSPAMLQVLHEKIRCGGLERMQTTRLDLLLDSVPESRYHLIVSNMVLHHVDRIDILLAAFLEMLLPGGFLAIADLDEEPGLFHDPEAAKSVHHHGFDRRSLIACLDHAGFGQAKDVTAHVVHKPTAGGDLRTFSVFLVVASRT